MRLSKLELLAYGHFRGLTLDFSASGLHVIHGRNEAGKSTTLRAITGLFYGIERNTTDAFLHAMKDLRIGGVIEGGGGEKVRLVRRKGASNTLLDERGQPLEETVMQRLLGGVSEETFRNAFGLDHGALEAGAQGLLQGSGDLGESLFDASVGGSGGEVQRLLADLANEADKIYKPRGSALPLNEALRAFTDAQRAVREKQSLPEAFLTQEQGLEDLTKERAERLATKAVLVAKRDRVARGRRRVPLERRRERALERRAAAGRLAGPDAIARIESLKNRFPSYEHALEQRRTLKREVERLADRLTEASRRAGLGDAHRKRTDALRLPAQQEGRIHKLLDDRTMLVERLESAKSEIARAERELARFEEIERAKPQGRAGGRSKQRSLSLFDADEPKRKKGELREDDGAALLSAALDRARALGDIEARVSDQRAKNERQERKLEARAQNLGLFCGSLEDFVKLRLPAVASVERLEARAEEVGRVTSRLEERWADLEREAAHLERQSAALAGDFAPPDAAALASARAARDDALRALADAIARGVTGGEVELERLIREADLVADRMIREADRVTTLARLKSETDANRRQREKIAADKEEAKKRRVDIEEEHARLFAAAKIEPLGFAEMCQWLDRQVQIVDAYESLREAKEELSDEASKVERARTDLASLLGADVSASMSLSELIAIGARKLSAIDERRRQAEEAARAITKLREEIEERTFARDRDEAAIAETKARLDELLAPLGIPSDAAAEEVNRSIEALRELFTIADARADAEARLSSAEADVLAFEVDLGRALSDLAADLVGGDARDVAPALFMRASEAAKNAHELATIEEQLTSEGEVTFADDEERRVVADLDAAARLEDELGDEIEEVERQVSRLTERIGATRLGLEQMRAESNAAEAAAEAQQALTRVREHVERWCRAKLAAALLSREIERYRDEHQAPLLLSSSSFFSRLTLSAFSGIRAGFDDKDRPCLRCVRADGVTEVDVAGLSDGTRDQLYLSLRLASLLRRAEVAESMPLVLDDVLIQLDDQRASAALSVLAEVARRMQVLFFTHHARLVELARHVIPAGELSVHELVTSSGAVSSASP